MNKNLPLETSCYITQETARQAIDYPETFRIKYGEDCHLSIDKSKVNDKKSSISIDGKLVRNPNEVVGYSSILIIQPNFAKRALARILGKPANATLNIGIYEAEA